MDTSATMTREVVVISPDATVDTARRLMEAWDIRHLPVVERGLLIGILSDRDVIRSADDPVRRCREVMTPAPLTCAPTTDVAAVARLMVSRKIDSVPVVDARGILVGLVTSSDLLDLLARETGSARLLPFDFRIRPVSDGEVAAMA
jgi:CBS domain-containing protein